MDEILDDVKKMEGEQKEIKNEVMKLCWFMRGSVSLDEGFSLSQEDRTIIGHIVKENLETTKKSGLPFY